MSLATNQPFIKKELKMRAISIPNAYAVVDMSGNNLFASRFWVYCSPLPNFKPRRQIKRGGQYAQKTTMDK